MSIVFTLLEQTRIRERRYVTRVARIDFDHALECGWCLIDLLEHAGDETGHVVTTRSTSAKRLFL